MCVYLKCINKVNVNVANANANKTAGYFIRNTLYTFHGRIIVEVHTTAEFFGTHPANPDSAFGDVADYRPFDCPFRGPKILVKDTADSVDGV